MRDVRERPTRARRGQALVAREEEFGPIFGAGVLLVVIGTLTYALGQDWSVIDALYFAVSTLTTTSVSDPDLVLNR